MTSPHLKIVTDDTEAEILALAKEIAAKKKQNALARIGDPRTADVLPPQGGEIRYDDITNAERFLGIFGDDLLYVSQAKRWKYWTGKYWEFDNEGYVTEAAIEFAKSLYSPENVINADAFKHAKRSNNKSGLSAFIAIAQEKQTVSIDTFDTDPLLLNCENGTFHLRTGELRSHNRADRITRIVNADFDADARSETFDNFLETIQPDPAIRAFLQRSIGYSLLGNVRERSFWILYGTGNNGKSVFINLFNNLLGEYASATTAASVMQQKQSAIPNDIARLKGKRFIVIPETEENERLHAALVKALSAGDKMTARFLFGEFFDFYFTGKLWIATNHKPTITDHSKGLWDRLKLIPFNQDIPKEKVIKADDLMAALLADASAVLNWALLGCKDYFDLDGLDVPPVIQAEIDAYRHEQDSIAQFIEEACVTIEQARSRVEYVNEADFRVSNSGLYKAYKHFCTENGEYCRSHTWLSRNMRERGFNERNSGGRFWEGVKLVNAV